MRLIMRIIISALLVISILSLTTMAYAEESESERQGFHYAHDPRDNPNAMKDIIVNSDAVYGFSPNPDSTRLGEYAGSIDWTDPDQVAEARQQRADYLASMSELYRMIEDMLGQARSVEEIARAVSKRRNELRLEAYKDDPEGLASLEIKDFDNYLVTAGIPDPDLLIRTSGEERISNYLLWQCAYTEFYFTDILWPDFRKNEFRAALEEYAQRDRRYGKVK